MSSNSNLLESIPYCDAFSPSEEEFKNFEKYVSKCQKLSRSGIFKIIPPKSFKPRKDHYKNVEFPIPYPIEQIVTGTGGIYEVILIQKESRSLSKYQKLVQSFDTLTENKSSLEIEKLFWKNLKFSAPLYGADSPGSLFDKGVDWNLSELDSLLKRGLDSNGILGVTSPYVYIGAWKTFFAWHKEDMDLNSINYNHFGRQKFWYAIPLECNAKFEEFMQKSFPEAYKECPEFLRHKTFLVHPEVLLKQGIKLHKCVQNQGEFVITLPGGYHSGFNAGFNIAEAVNFALKNWVDVGKTAKSCGCRGDSVKINMDDFLDNLKRRSEVITKVEKSISRTGSGVKKNKMMKELEAMKELKKKTKLKAKKAVTVTGSKKTFPERRSRLKNKLERKFDEKFPFEKTHSKRRQLRDRSKSKKL